MRYRYLLIAFMVSNMAVSEEITSLNSQNGSLFISNDHHSIEYQNQEGERFPLYFYNDYFSSIEEGGEQYFLKGISNSGRYAALERRIYFVDEESVAESFSVDFMDLGTGCVFYTLNSQRATGAWSEKDDAIWIITPENPANFIDVEKLKGNILPAAGIYNAYLCNLQRINDRDFNIALLANIKELMAERDEDYLLSDEVLNQSMPHDVWGLLTLLSDDNVTFFNDFALELLATKTLLDDDPHYLSSIIILENIVNQYPDRTQTILHLADAYSFSSLNLAFQRKALEKYQQYYEVMKNHQQEALIPSRVLQKLEIK